MNNVSLFGRLGQDPEIRFFESGNCRASLSIAIKGRVKRDGQWVDQPVWVQCEAWGKLASEVIANYCKKGSAIVVGGKLKVDSWNDRETGAKRSKMLVLIQNLELTGGKQSDNAQSRPPAPQAQPVSGYEQQDTGRPMDDYDEIPF